MSAVIDIAKDLIARPSLTPSDAGCQDYIAERLQRLGFSVEHLPFGNVKNLWARLGQSRPLLCLLGHTDVVPTGPAELWTTPPFKPDVRNGNLYGRGACDMKGGLAAMLAASETFLATKPALKGSLAMLLTSDEEGPAVDGTVKVIETLSKRGERIDYCLVGEPSGSKQAGDTIRNGRRGSLSLVIRIQGKQGHVAYPHLVVNPIHRAAPFLAALAATEWDKGTASFPPTSFQVTRIQADGGAGNVVPGEVIIDCNFRFSPAAPAVQLEARVRELAAKHGLGDIISIKARSDAQPFITEAGKLLDAVRAAISEVAGITCEASTGGGTSDGRFVAPTGAEVVELGPANTSAHAIDEYVTLADLEALTQIYASIMRRLLL